MLRRIGIAACIASTCAVMPPRPAAAGELVLLSRSLVQGPARAAVFGAGGLILGTGGGVAVFSGADRLEEPAFLPLDGEPHDLVLRGDILYAASFAGGLVTIDLSDPGRPVETNRREIAQAARCASAGGALFVCGANRALHVFSLENPREPHLRGSRELPHQVVSIPAEDDLLAIVYGRRVEILRADASGSLEPAASIELPADARDAVVRRGVLVVLTAAGEAFAWDIARPESPRPLGALKRRKISGVASGEGGCVLLGASRTIIPFDVERDGAGAARIRVGKAASLPPRVSPAPGTAGTGGSGASRAIERVIVSSGRIAAIAPLDGVDLYARDRAGLHSLDFFPTRGFAIDVATAGGLVYLANGNDGVRIGRLGDAGTVEWLSHLQTKDARGVAISGERLFVADGAGGLKTADVGDPARPRILGVHASPYYLSALVVRGGRAYCAGGLGGAEIVDVSDPRRPRLVWRRAFSEVRGIDADERYLYVADGYEGLRLFALDGPEPRLVSTLDTPGWTCGVAVDGDRAYLADGGRGVVVADLSSPERPRVAGASPTGSVARQVRFDGGYLFVAAFTRGALAFDVSDPALPREAARYQTAGDARGVSIAEDRVLVASGGGGLYVLSHSR